MNQFIYKLSINAPFRNKDKWTDQQEVIVSKHFNYLLKLKTNNVVLLAGKTNYDIDHDENFGIVIFQSDTVEKAQSIMMKDPAVAAKLMSAKLYPFTISMIKD